MRYCNHCSKSREDEFKGVHYMCCDAYTIIIEDYDYFVTPDGDAKRLYKAPAWCEESDEVNE